MQKLHSLLTTLMTMKYSMLNTIIMLASLFTENVRGDNITRVVQVEFIEVVQPVSILTVTLGVETSCKVTSSS